MNKIVKGDIVKVTCYLETFYGYVADTCDQESFLIAPINQETGEAQERCIWVNCRGLEFTERPEKNRYDRQYSRTEKTYVSIKDRVTQSGKELEG